MNNLLKHTKAFVERNASTILTCVAGAGVVVTSVMAVKATPKALTLLEKAEEEKGEKLTTFEVVKTAGPAYIPTIVSGTATIACVFGANILNKRHQAAMMSAYALLDNSYKEYKKKVEELYGEGADMNVRSEIAKDKYEQTDILVKDDERLYYDDFSGRYFKSTTEKILKAEYEVNRILAEDGCLFLNEFYELLGLEIVDYGDFLGWSSFEIMETTWNNWLYFEHTKVILDDGLECTIISMGFEPTFEFENY